jgi:arylsulfatase
MSNVAVIVLDTLRKDTFDRHFDWLEGKRFENAWSTSHWTVPAHASLFTGEYASDAGCYARSPHLDCEKEVLAELLANAGYQTRAFSANRHVTPYFGFGRGFDEFERFNEATTHDDRILSRADYFSGPTHRRPVQIVKAIAGGARKEFDAVATVRHAYQKLYDRFPLLPDGKTSVGAALSYVRETEFDDDEFLFMNLMDVHGPYKPPLRYQRQWYSTDDIRTDVMATFTGASIDGTDSRNAYEDCARYLSAVLREVLAGLDGFEYVIILSDHGESFGENGVWAHPVGLHPELTHVPLVVQGPDVDRTEVTAPVNLLDVFATVLDIGGVTGETTGQSLLTEVDPQPCLTEFHGILYNHLIDRIRDHGVPERRISEYDEPCAGVALAPTYYGYESTGEFISEGSSN